jgi:hypothetical protein
VDFTRNEGATVQIDSNPFIEPPSLS